jgi:hypothetical protein
MKNPRHQKDEILQPINNEAALKPYPKQATAREIDNIRGLLACIYPELTRVQRLDIHTTNKALRRDRRRHR